MDLLHPLSFLCVLQFLGKEIASLLDEEVVPQWLHSWGPELHPAWRVESCLLLHSLCLEALCDTIAALHCICPHPPTITSTTTTWRSEKPQISRNFFTLQQQAWRMQQGGRKTTRRFCLLPNWIVCDLAGRSCQEDHHPCHPGSCFPFLDQRLLQIQETSSCKLGALETD